nr:ankyrin repeat domain-containing protein [Pseudenhygromyxa sp. WMMC2535]
MLAAGLPAAGPAGAEASEVDVPLSEIVGASACEHLLASGCAREARDQRGLRALHWAAIGLRTRCADVLLRAGVEVDPLDNLGRTPLMLAVARGAPIELLERLLDAGADPDHRDEQGWTALHYLASFAGGRSQQRKAKARLLTARGGRASRDRVGRTPATLCVLQGVPHRDGSALDERTPVAAGPGRARELPSLAAPAGLVLPLLSERVPEPGLAPRGRGRPRPDPGRWSVWADWLLGQGDPRGELVSTSIAAAASGRHARPRLEAACRELAARLRVRLDAGLFAADPLALVRPTPLELERTHGFVTMARIHEQQVRHAGVSARAIPGVISEAARQLLIHEPLLAELHVAIEQAEGWSLLAEQLGELPTAAPPSSPAPYRSQPSAGAPPSLGLRRLALHRLPAELPDLAGLPERLPGLRSLWLIGAGKLRGGHLRWPGLVHLRLRHGDTSEWTRGGVALTLELPDLRALDLGLPISPRAGLGRVVDEEVEGLTALLAGLPPGLSALRLSPVPRRFLQALIDSPLLPRLRTLELPSLRSRALELLADRAAAFGHLETLRISVSPTVIRTRGLLLEQVQAALPRAQRMP